MIHDVSDNIDVFDDRVTLEKVKKDGKID